MNVLISIRVMSALNSTIFYHCWKSSSAYRIRICLNYKKIPFESRAIELDEIIESNKSGKSNEKVKELEKYNPMKFVPVLRIDGLSLMESMPIMEYLEERNPENSLLPKNQFQRFQSRSIASIFVSGIQPLQNIGVLKVLSGSYSTIDKEVLWAQHWIKKGFKAVETYLQSTSGKYCVGDMISFADICLVPQVFNARKFNVDLKSYPTILRIDRELEQHEAFIKSHPFNQEDFPAEKYPNNSFFDIYK